METQLRPRNVILGIPRIRGKERLIEVVLKYKLPVAELRPKYLMALSKAILDSGAEIMVANQFSDEKTTYMIFFIELGKAKLSVEEIEEKLKNLGFISEVLIFEPKPLLFDVAHFPLTNGIEKICVVSTEVFAQIYEEMIHILGSGAFTILWHLGLRTGRIFIDLIKKLNLLNRLDKKEFLLAFKQLYQVEGWGIIEYIDVNFKQKTGIIRVHQSMAESVMKRYNKPICYYTSGVLTTLLQEVFDGADIRVEEVKCMAMGAPYCEFKW